MGERRGEKIELILLKSYSRFVVRERVFPIIIITSHHRSFSSVAGNLEFKIAIRNSFLIVFPLAEEAIHNNIDLGFSN